MRASQTCGRPHASESVDFEASDRCSNSPESGEAGALRDPRILLSDEGGIARIEKNKYFKQYSAFSRKVSLPEWLRGWT